MKLPLSVQLHVLQPSKKLLPGTHIGFWIAWSEIIQIIYRVVTRGQKEKRVLNISRETYQDRSQWHTETRTIWRTSLFNSPPFSTVSSTDPRPLCTLVSSTLPHRPFPTFIKLVYRSFTIYIEFPSNPFCCNAFLHTFYKSINNVYK